MKFIFHHPVASIDIRREQQNPTLDDEEGYFPSGNEKPDEHAEMEIEDYTSKLKRDIFPCFREREVKRNLSEAYIQARCINEQDSAQVFYEGKDTVLMFQACKKE